MNSREKLSELPLNRFYRYVLEPQLTFDKDGALSEGPFSLFSDMPESVLLTMGIDTPLGWMVEAVYSPYDLDNIKLQDVSLRFWVKAACYPYLRSGVWGHCVTLIACIPRQEYCWSWGEEEGNAFWFLSKSAGVDAHVFVDLRLYFIIIIIIFFFWGGGGVTIWLCMRKIFLSRRRRPKY